MKKKTTSAEDAGKGSRLDPRRYSRLVVDGIKQAPARAMLHAVGFADADFDKPQVGIASTWSNLTPCNMHIDGLARLAAQGVECLAKSLQAVSDVGRRIERKPCKKPGCLQAGGDG